MSPSERRFPRLHDRQAALLAENVRLREVVRNNNWHNGDSAELTSIQATIADNEKELDELNQVLPDKVPLAINLILAGLLVVMLIAYFLTQM